MILLIIFNLAFLFSSALIILQLELCITVEIKRFNGFVVIIIIILRVVMMKIIMMSIILYKINQTN